MVDHSIGKIFVELAMDYEPYTRAQKQLLKDVTSTTLNVEKNFKDLHIKSSAELDLLRQKAENAFQRIANSSKATANDILRAEQAKNDQLSRLNEMQFGKQTSMISQLKSHWLATTAVIYGAVASIGKAWDLAKQGADYDEQHGLLDNLARKYKSTADSIVSDMARAAEGQIANADLMQVALSGLSRGLTVEQLTNLSDAARILGDVVGKDATTALKDLTEALETGRARGLKGYLGSALDLETAFGDLVSKMTAAEKSQAMYNMTMIQAIKLQAEQTTGVDEAGDKIERLEAKWKNATTEVARFFKVLLVGIYDAATTLPPDDMDLLMGEKSVSNILRFPMPKRPNPEAANPYEAENESLKALLQTRKDAAKEATAQAKDDQQHYEDALRQMKFQQDAQDKLDDESYKQAISDRAALVKIQNDLTAEEEKATKQAEKLAGDRSTAYRAMYKDLRKLGDENYSAEMEMINKQADEYRKLGVDEILVAEWVAKKEEDLLDERDLAYGNLFDGIRIGLKDITRDTTSWAQVSHAAVTTFARESQSDLSNLLFDAVKGDLKEFSDYWEGLWDSMLRSTTDKVAQMAVEAATSIGAKLLGQAGGTIWDWAGTLFASQGLWDVQGNEVPVIAHEGEMILPKNMAEQLREMYGGFGSMAMDTTPANPNDPSGWNAFVGGLQGAGRGALSGIPGGPGAMALGGLLGFISGSFNTSVGPTNPGTGIGSGLGAFLLGGPMGAIFGGLTGTYLGNAIPDWLDARQHEALMDVLEDAGFGYGASAALAGLVTGDMGALMGSDAFGDMGGWSGEGAPGVSDADGGDAGIGGGGPGAGGDPGWAKGTGPAGLPYTGRFIGHQNEVVLNPRESQAYREGMSRSGGSDRPIELHVHVLDKEFVTTIRKESEQVIVNRNGRGMSASTQKVYS